MASRMPNISQSKSRSEMLLLAILSVSTAL
jgi:hypothetical protein